MTPSEEHDDPGAGPDPGADQSAERQREIDDLLSGKAGPPGRTGEAGGRQEAPEDPLPVRKPAVPAAARSEGSAIRRTAEGQDDPVDSGASGGGIRLPFNYSALVGFVLVLIIAAAVVSLLTGRESGTVGIGDVGIGERVAPFAVPIANSDLEGDANIDPDEACDVPGEDVLRICDYFDRPTIVSFWFTTGASACIDQQDIFETVAERFAGRVNAVSINVRDDRRRVRELIEERGWRVPVGHDTDGAVSSIYRVGGCPTFLFVAPGGVLEQAEIGQTTVEELSAQVRSFADGQ